MPRPYKNFRRKRHALREARRLEAQRKSEDKPIYVWHYRGGYIGRGYYVGTRLPERITNSKAVVTLISIGGRTSIGGSND